MKRRDSILQNYYMSKLPKFDVGSEIEPDPKKKRRVPSPLPAFGLLAGIAQQGRFQGSNKDKNILQRNINKNLYPVSYRNPFIRTVAAVLGLQDPNRQEFEEDLQTGYLKETNKWDRAKMNRMDALNMYQGYPQRFNTFSISQYTPSESENPYAVYYKINDPNSQSQLLKMVKVVDGKEELTSLGNDRQFRLYDRRRKGTFIDRLNNVMGNYKVSLGEDEKGKYLSYYDLWDIAPLQDYGVDLPVNFGNPYEIYDRVYYKNVDGNIVPLEGDRSPLKMEIKRTLSPIKKKADGGWLNEYELPKAQKGFTSSDLLNLLAVDQRERNRQNLYNWTSIGAKQANPNVKVQPYQPSEEYKKAVSKLPKKTKEGPSVKAQDMSREAVRLREEAAANYRKQQAIQNSALAQSFGALTPGGYNPGAGTIGAETFININPITAPAMSASRLTQQALGQNPYGFGDGFGSNALATLGLVGDVAGVGSVSLLPGSTGITTRTPLKNIYKINPASGKIPMVGEKPNWLRGYSKDYSDPTKIDFSGMSKFSDQASKSAVKKLNKLDDDWRALSQAERDNPEIYNQYHQAKQKLLIGNKLQNTGLGKLFNVDDVMGAGSYSEFVSPLKYSPDVVLKYSTKEPFEGATRSLFEAGKSIRDPQIGLPFHLQELGANKNVTLTPRMQGSTFGLAQRSAEPISRTAAAEMALKLRQLNKQGIYPDWQGYNFLRNPETGAVSVIDLNTLPGSGAARAFTEGNRIGQNPATIIKQNWNLKPRLRSTKGVDDLGPYTERGGNKFYDLEGGYTDELSKLSDEEFAKYVSGLSDAEKLALYGLESERRTPYVVNELKKPINELIDTRSKAVTLPITTQERINTFLNYITNPIKQNKQGGPLVNNNGYKDGRPPKGSNWRITGDTVYNPTGETILAKANTGEQAILQPYDKSSITFQNADYIDEYHLTSKTDNWLDDYKAKLGGPYNSSWMLTNPKPKPVHVPKMQFAGTPQPIYTSDPRDPRLRDYQDSLSLYKGYKNYELDKTKPIEVYDKNDMATLRAMYPNTKLIEGKPKPLSSYDYWVLTESGRKTNFKVGKTYSNKELALEQNRGEQYQNRQGRGLTKNKGNLILDWGNRAVRSSTIAPIGMGYGDMKDIDNWNAGLVTIYKKPVQPVEYRKRTLERPNLDLPEIEFEALPQPNVEYRSGSAANPKMISETPTKYSYTYPSGNEQKTIYFPSKSSWKAFTEQYDGLSTEERAGSFSASPGTYSQLRRPNPAFDNLKFENGGWLHQYKKGGEYGGLDRWFAEKWVDVKTGKPCGRQEGENRGYPACRPSKRVSSKTPKTSSELSSEEKARFKSSKTSSQRIPYSHKRRK